MKYVIALVVLTAAASLQLMAAPAGPEIDPGTGTAAFTFLTGAAILVRARAKR